jgi:hypothetical protein
MVGKWWRMDFAFGIHLKLGSESRSGAIRISADSEAAIPSCSGGQCGRGFPVRQPMRDTWLEGRCRRQISA